MESQYLTSGQAARRLGIAKGTLLRAMRRGAITPVSQTPGGCFRFRAADIEAYARQLASLSQAGPSEVQAGVGDGRFRALVTAIAEIVWTAAADGRGGEDVPLWRAYTGQSVEDIQGWGWLDAVHAEDRDGAAQAWAQAVASGTLYETEYRLRRADGLYRPFLARAAPVRDEAGRIQEWAGVCIDLTNRYHSEADLRATVETALDAIVTINHSGRIVAFNPAAEQIFGYQRSAVLGQELAELIIPPALREQHRAGLAAYLATGAGPLLGRRVEVTALRANGSLFPAELAIVRIPLDGPPLFTGYIRDITERKQAEEALRHQALHDALTGLPNRTLLIDRLAQALGAAQRAGRPLALLLLGLDRFKEVNTSFGHHAGDLLVRQVAGRLRGTLRAADTVARLGGDEFAALLPGEDSLGATVAVHKLLAALDAPFLVDGQALHIGASVGIALSPEHGADAQTLLRHADVALYVAKQSQSPSAVYVPVQDQDSRRRLALLEELRQAIASGGLRLYYQPTVGIAQGRVRGVEALVRWPHPRHGFIPPDQFIPLAEQTGLIAPLTHWVLAEALRQSREWRRAGRSLAVSINLSMRDVHDQQLPDAIAELLSAYAVPSHALRVELTESAIMADAARALDVLTRLAALDVHISVDDFGTGYSSLAYLKRLPVDEIKIDQSFVRQMTTESNDAAIVASTIELGRGLGLCVVAEGVEDRATWDRLAALGCDVAQGYYLSRPLPPAELARWLHETPWAVA